MVFRLLSMFGVLRAFPNRKCETRSGSRWRLNHRASQLRSSPGVDVFTIRSMCLVEDASI